MVFKEFEFSLNMAGYCMTSALIRPEGQMQFVYHVVLKSVTHQVFLHRV